MSKKIKIVYSEPADYFPEEIRKKYKLGEFAESKELQKIKAVMIGHAVGDALGVPVEFEDRETRKKHPVTEMQGFGTYPVPAGSWSDDTSMSLCALDALANNQLDLFDTMCNFAEWLGNAKYTPTGQTFDVGRTCMKAIINFVRAALDGDFYTLPSGFDVTAFGLNDEYSNGNGSLMRIHPFVLYSYFNGLEQEIAMEIVRKASAITHAHDRAVMACYIYSYMLSFLLKEPTRDSFKAALKSAGEDLENLPEFVHYKRIFEPDFADLPESEIKSSGYVVDTIEAAIWCLLTTDNYRDCVLKAVNLGGDTDTIAAVAGGLAGALYGYDTMPEEWLEALQRREYIEELCTKAYNNWSKE